MFTIKLYKDGRQKILSAESFTILRNFNCTPDDGGAEITLHQKSGEDSRYDVTSAPRAVGSSDTFDKAIIENAAGRTTEIIQLRPRGP